MCVYIMQLLYAKTVTSTVVTYQSNTLKTLKCDKFDYASKQVNMLLSEMLSQNIASPYAACFVSNKSDVKLQTHP